MDETYERELEDVIAVMGPTGVGKTSFVRTATGDEYVPVGHGLESCQCQYKIFCKQNLISRRHTTDQRPSYPGRQSAGGSFGHAGV
jgi:GTPase SAR1 family protein